MKIYSYGIPELNIAINEGIDTFLNATLKENVITKEQLEILQTYRIVIGEKGCFGKIFDKVMNLFQDSKYDNYQFYYVCKVIK